MAHDDGRGQRRGQCLVRTRSDVEFQAQQSESRPLPPFPPDAPRPPLSSCGGGRRSSLTNGLVSVPPLTLNGRRERGGTKTSATPSSASRDVLAAWGSQSAGLPQLSSGFYHCRRIDEDDCGDGRLDPRDDDTAAPDRESDEDHRILQSNGDIVSAQPRKLSSLHIAGTFLSQMCAAIQVTLPFAISPYLVRHFGYTDEEEIDRLSGLLPSLFCLGQFLTALGLGKMSDVAGRKSVVVAGNLASTMLLIAFGLCGSYWQAAFVQVLSGCFNGVSGALFAIAGEFDDSTQARLLLCMSVAWGLGTTLGPVMGGFFSTPCDFFPEPFPMCREGGLLYARPFLLPYLAASALTSAAFIFSMFMKENMSHDDSHKTLATEGHNANVEAPLLQSYMKDEALMMAAGCVVADDGRDAEAWWHRPSVLLSVLGTSSYAFLFTAWDEISPIYASEVMEEGGLGLTSNELGLAMSMGGVALALYAVFGCQRMIQWVGVKRLACWALRVTSLVVLLWPLAACLATKNSKWRSMGLLCLGYVLRAVADNSIITSTAMLVNLAAPPRYLGAVNGLNGMGMAFLRMLGPAVGGWLWGLTSHMQPPLLHNFAAYACLSMGALATSFIYATRALDML